MSKANRASKKQNRNLAILTPLDVEKWAVFSSKMSCPATTPNACQGDHRVTRAILSEIPGIDVKGTIALFKKLGGHCDCEVLTNAMRHLEREYNGICDVCYFKKVVGEELDPDSPKLMGFLGSLNLICTDSHEKRHA